MVLEVAEAVDFYPRLDGHQRQFTELLSKHRYKPNAVLRVNFTNRAIELTFHLFLMNLDMSLTRRAGIYQLHGDGKLARSVNQLYSIDWNYLPEFCRKERLHELLKRNWMDLERAELEFYLKWEDILPTSSEARS